MIGTKLGPYEITAKLGEGGMGEVYRATDTKLRREVAIKVLPAAFTEDKERLARFEREAQLLAQLNHPNIASIHGLEEAGGVRALVMELVEGPTLAERLEQGSLPFHDALLLARQIAEALEEAHTKGIVHRDLKPQNVKAALDGKVKVLDFGLAKAMDPAAGSAVSAADLARSPTLMQSPTLTAAQGTQLGVILGTAAYMSPEQARGGAVDKRADIWAFGVVFFEMLVGRSLFAADTVGDTLAGVLKTEIDFGLLPEATPAAVQRLLRRCLERNPKNRLHDIADARIVLDEVLAGKNLDPAAAATVPPAPRPRALLALSAALLATVALAAGWFLARGISSVAKPAPLRLSVVFPDELVVQRWQIERDGSALLLQARRRDDPQRRSAIYRRELGAEKPVLLAGSEESDVFLITPDGRSILFTRPEPADPSSRRVLRMPIDGSEPPIELAAWDRAWSDFGLLADGDPIATDSVKLDPFERGADAAQAVAIDVGRSGSFSFFVSPPPTGGKLLMRMESWSGRGYQLSTALVDPTTGHGSVLIEDGANAFFVPPDRLLVSRGSTLLGVRFDPETGRLAGRPVALVEGLRIEEAWQAAPFSISNDGTLTYPPGGLVGAERRFVALDPASGAVEPWSSEARSFSFVTPQPSPAGDRIFAQLANAAGTYEIWAVPRSGPAQPVVALSEADAAGPLLSPDGKTIAFARTARQPSDGVYVASVDRSAAPRELLRVPDPDSNIYPRSWSPDGQRLLASQFKGGAMSILELTLDSPGKSRELVPAPASRAVFAPNGRQIAFQSSVSGRNEVYLVRYAAGAEIGERIAISRDGGREPHWSPDGRALYFLNRERKILVAAISPEGRPVGEPRVVADCEDLKVADEFNVLADGRLLLLRHGAREDEISHAELILHFDRLLEERLP